MSINRKEIEKLMTGGSALTAFIAATIAASVMFSNVSEKPTRKRDDNLDKIVQRIQKEQDSYEKLNKLEKQVSQLTTHIESLKEIKNDNKVSLHIKHINDMYDRNDKRISKIEEVIIDDPAKAINLVLLKNDIETMKKTIELQREFSKQEVDRIYMQNQWLMGTLIALSLSIIGLVVPNFLSKNKSQKENT